MQYHACAFANHCDSYERNHCQGCGEVEKANGVFPSKEQAEILNILIGKAISKPVKKQKTMPDINKVIFNDPATIVYWDDGSKTVVKAENDIYDPEKGLAMAISKRALGNEGNYYNVFKKYLPVKEERVIELKSVQEFELTGILDSANFGYIFGNPSSGNFTFSFDLSDREEK